MSQSTYESFGWSTIQEVGDFVVNFGKTTKQLINRKGKNGDYTTTEYSIEIRSALFSNPLVITGVSQKHYDRMRILSLQGLIKLSVTRQQERLGEPSYMAPYIISGVKA